MEGARAPGSDGEGRRARRAQASALFGGDGHHLETSSFRETNGTTHAMSAEDFEHFKGAMLRFLLAEDYATQQAMMPVLAALLRFDEDEAIKSGASREKWEPVDIPIGKQLPESFEQAANSLTDTLGLGSSFSGLAFSRNNVDTIHYPRAPRVLLVDERGARVLQNGEDVVFVGRDEDLVLLGANPQERHLVIRIELLDHALRLLREMRDERGVLHRLRRLHAGLDRHAVVVDHQDPHDALMRVYALHRFLNLIASHGSLPHLSYGDSSLRLTRPPASRKV